ncbi:MAG: cytochrome c [Gammaproteobacteria bacterium]|nr:cytochrome c [Gammaproteobacteria bacterium]MDH4253613.1 cytochrome c [Gammaproteobacteria bacterium]MDH5310376.1 cytochrome c [Gammaproteobacteria bacterium]
MQALRSITVIAIAIPLALAAGASSADPRSDYLLHCAGCHQPNGLGLPPEVPSLVGPLGAIASSSEGRDYLARVPGASQAPLTDDELAAVLNWILTEFNGDTLPEDFRPLRGKEIGKSRSNVLSDPVRLRNELWPDLDDAT